MPTLTAKFSISDQEFKLIRELVYSRFGINLTSKKRTLVVGRLQNELINKNFKSFKEYYKHIINDKTGEALSTLVDRISTNHTYFNRENAHYDYLSKEVFTKLATLLARQNKQKIRIWCAGCSSGEEPYTLALLIHEFFKTALINWNVRILATDISSVSLKLAVMGVYKDENISRIPTVLRNKYFNKQKNGLWEAHRKLKDIVLFRRLNLMRPNFPFKNKFHIIFCRNVMIYFDEPTRINLVKKFYDFTEPDGYLFVGHSETIRSEECKYKYLKPAVYYKEAP